MTFTDIAIMLAANGILAAEPEFHAQEIPLAGVTANSRRVKPGMIFCAVSGSRIDGSKFISAAITAGAAGIVTSVSVGTFPVPVIKVKDDYLAFSILVRAFAGSPDQGLSLSAVTGTNGKTTTVYALKAIDSHPAGCGIITTITTGYGNNFRSSTHTTPDAEKFFALLTEMKQAECKDIYFEASSHALTQSRMGNIKLQSGIFTNLTRDHMDYHGTMENYYQAKKRLFTHYLAEGGKAVINTDDPAGARLKKELQQECSGRFDIHDFGTSSARHELRILAQEEGMGCKFMLSGHLYRSNLTGDYNIYNLAGAILATHSQNIPDFIKVNVPGRLEAFIRTDGARAFVDFAHTDDALTRVLSELRKISSGRVIVVFGAGGDRDRSKRPEMGKAVSRAADIAVVTSDNPRSEDPESIIAEIISGMDPGTCMIYARCDRKSAIREACLMAEKDDIILVAGKGHEMTQEIKGDFLHFSDAAELCRNGFSC